MCLLAATCPLLFAEARGVFSISDFGARPGGVYSCTEAIAAAVSAASRAGGGRVLVPDGLWLTGPVRLESGVELHLSDGALLSFSPNPEDYLPPVRTSYSGIECYNYSPLLYACGATNVSLTGGGTISPRMDVWRTWFNRETPGMVAATGMLYRWGESDYPVEKRVLTDIPGARFRPCCIEFENCRRVRLEGFRVRGSPLWTVHLRLCEDVVASGLDIVALGNNNDGIDVDASRRVLIEKCTFEQGDDAIVVKSGRDRDGRRVGVPAEDIEVRDCTVRRGNVLVGIGSEVSGGVRNVFVHDCRATGPVDDLVLVKTSDRKGAFIENVTVSNVTAVAAGTVVAVQTDVNYQWGAYAPGETVLTRISGLRVFDVFCGIADEVYRLNGDARLPVRDVELCNVRAGIVRVREGVAVNVEGFSRK